LSLSANEQGDYFPVWATCLGFEALSVLISEDPNILGTFDAGNLTLALNFSKDFKNSRLFSLASPDIIETLSTKKVTMNNHNAGVTPDNWYSNKNLVSFFHVLSTNKDRNGKEFISTIEGKFYPIYGTQWHPEKPIYEWWEQEVICHTDESVKANQYMANFFLREARKNNHTFPSREEEWKNLIYSFSPHFTYYTFQEFVQVYAFK